MKLTKHLRSVAGFPFYRQALQHYFAFILIRSICCREVVQYRTADDDALSGKPINFIGGKGSSLGLFFLGNLNCAKPILPFAVVERGACLIVDTASAQLTSFYVLYLIIFVHFHLLF